MHLNSSKDLSVNQVKEIFAMTKSEKRLEGKTMGYAFFEPSTRTRLSFEAAAKQLGASVIGFSDVKVTSLTKGESFTDTVRMLSGYVDCLVIRHNEAFKPAEAAEVAGIPVINAGDGDNEHPTQALVDAFTIQQEKEFAGLKVALVGDLRYGRTVHSLVPLLQRLGAKIVVVHPDGLGLSDQFLEGDVERAESVRACIKEVDVMYMTRLQEERLPHGMTSGYTEAYCLTKEVVQEGKNDLMILHPLPRIQEIHPAVDGLPQAKYFVQAKNGLAVRKAILRYVL